MTKPIKLHGSNFFATFKTEKELKEYIEKHNKEEQLMITCLNGCTLNF